MDFFASKHSTLSSIVHTPQAGTRGFSDAPISLLGQRMRPDMISYGNRSKAFTRFADLKVRSIAFRT